jgi:hypothetical protein
MSSIDSVNNSGFKAVGCATLCQVLAIQEKRLGPEHSDVARTFNNLARAYFAEARYAEAESLALVQTECDPTGAGIMA